MNVFEQDRAYRRGMVLGLTMAEVVILVIFSLLLALAIAINDRDQRIVTLETLNKSDASKEIAMIVRKEFPESEAKSWEDLARRLRETIQQARAFAPYVSNGKTAKSVAEDLALADAVRQVAKRSGYADPAEMLEQVSQREGVAPVDAWPPFINLSDADGYHFATGSAELAPKLREALSGNIADTLAELVRKYRVDVVEVIGHTDEQKMGGLTTLDVSLIPALNGVTSAEALHASDNAGLGMARAVSVVRALKKDTRFVNVAILPLSAGQLIEPVDHPATGTNPGDVPERRRIEIRLRRSSKEAGKGL